MRVVQNRRPLLQVMKVVVSLGLIVFLLMKISPGRLVSVIEATRPADIVAALVIFFTSGILGAFQWHLLLRAGGIVLPFSRTFRLYFVGLFFNNFLPANVGGDAVKIYDVSRFGNDPYQVFAITLLDRVIGITGLCLLAIIASSVLLGEGSIENLKIYVVVFVGCIAPVIALTVNRRLSGVVKRMFGMITWWGLGERFGTVFEHLGGFRKLRILLVKLTLLAIVVQFLRVGTHIAVGKALGIDIAPAAFLYFFVFIPLLGLLMVLPISINGLGIREGTGVLLFTQIGLLEEQAFLIEFITYVVMVAVSLVGGFIFLERHLNRREPPEGNKGG
jgi:uncharacterized protein (TIRG00374 family)